MENKVSIHGSNVHVSNSTGTKIGNISINQSYDLQAIDEVVDKAKKLSSSGEISDREKNLLDKGILSLENTKRNHPLPNKVVQEALKTIRNVAEGITGSTLATGLLSIIRNLT